MHFSVVELSEVNDKIVDSVIITTNKFFSSKLKMKEKFAFFADDKSWEKAKSACSALEAHQRELF